jgi:hypothetical protein
MKYTVVSTPLADLQLAEIWLQALDRQQVADASNEIHTMLRNDPEHTGRVRASGRRVVILKPLEATFEVKALDKLVTIVSIRFYSSLRRSS